MTKIIEYNVTGQSIELSSAAMLVAGTVNEYTARFSFDADWDGYQRVAVFNADGTEREQLLTDDTCEVPWEVLLPGACLKVGVYGTRDGQRLPTIWTTHRQYINDGAGPTDEAAAPSPVLAEQMLQRMGDLGQLQTEDKSSLVAAVNEVKETGGGGGTSDHSKLKNRDAADQHPMSAITGLDDALAGKQPTGDYLTKEQDPTVPDWAKQPQKPAYTAQEVGALPVTTHIPSTATEVNAEPSGAVSQHNVSDVAHNDIRLLIQGLSDRLIALADSDDTTLDQMSEVVAYIKSNRDLISSVTTSKVSVADIVDNLTTNVANKPLSAAQGVALKALIDALTEAMPEPYTLPIANETTLGGVKPVAKTDEMTQPVGVDDAGSLWAKAASGSGSSGGATPTLVYSHTCDGTYVSAIDDLPLEEGKIYATIMTIPAGSSASSFYCRIGCQGNTYTGAVAGMIIKQNSVVSKRCIIVHMINSATIKHLSVCADDGFTKGNLSQEDAGKIGDKIYLYTTASGENMPSGLSVEVYKLN